MAQEPYGIGDLARLCRVSPDTVRRWTERGGLRFSGTGDGLKVERADLAVFLTSHGIWVPREVAGADSPCVLVVEDEPDMRGLVSRVVRRMIPAARIHEAADGFEAGQRVMALEPDIVVLDIHLPGLEGTRVCANLRSCEGFRRTRVVAISGDKDPALRESAMKEGADAFLAKPFYPGDLEAVLARFLPMPQDH